MHRVRQADFTQSVVAVDPTGAARVYSYSIPNAYSRRGQLSAGRRTAHSLGIDQAL